jgi:hypothetical protein
LALTLRRGALEHVRALAGMWGAPLPRIVSEGDPSHPRLLGPITALIINGAKALTYMDLNGQISLIGGNLSDFRANSDPMLCGCRK